MKVSDERGQATSSDAMWRQTSYNLLQLPLDAAKMTYRTRLEFESKREEDDIYSRVLEALRYWFEKEELKHGQSESSEVLSVFRSIERFTKGGIEARSTDTSLRIEAFVSNAESSDERYWSIQYVERDILHGYRFWVTDVGLTSLAIGACVMNLRKRYLDDSTFVYESEEPQRRAPTMMRQLLRIPDCEVRNGGMALSGTPLEITDRTLEAFVSELTSRNRTVPLVVIASQEVGSGTGSYLVRPRYLARRLRGVANVYTLNRNVESVERAYARVFGNPDLPAFKYRLEPGALRIFWSDVDLEHPGKYDYARHRFFTAEALLLADEDQVIQNIIDGITRMGMRRPGEVLDLRSVEQHRSMAEAKWLELARSELAERVADSEERRKRLEVDLRNSGEWREQDEELKASVHELEEYVELLDQENEKLKDSLEMYKGGCTAEELRDLSGMIEESEKKARDAEGEARNLEGKLGYSEHLNELLREELQDERNSSRANEGMAHLLLDVGEYLRDGRAAAMLAKRALGSRVVLLDEATASASDFNGDASEMYQALVAMYTVLWEMRFGDGGSSVVSEREFKARSGFEVTFREKKLTNQNASLTKMRKRTFEGQQIDITPHVKGSSNKGYLRIHFAFVPERRLIVVGHCGNHMPTAGSSKLK